MMAVVIYDSSKNVIGVSLSVPDGISLALDSDPSLKEKDALDRLEMFEINKARIKDS